MARILYKPIGLLVSVVGGVLAGALFKRVWRLAAGEKDAPKATDERRGWGEVLAAQGRDRPRRRDRLRQVHRRLAGPEEALTSQ